MLGYLPLLLVTLAVEVVVVFALAPRDVRVRALQVCVSLNLVTHPVATLILLHANAPFVLLEVTIALVEFVGYRVLVAMGVGRALLIAFLANLTTAVMAVFL